RADVFGGEHDPAKPQARPLYRMGRTTQKDRQPRLVDLDRRMVAKTNPRQRLQRRVIQHGALYAIEPDFDHAVRASNAVAESIGAGQVDAVHLDAMLDRVRLPLFHRGPANEKSLSGAGI